MSGTGLLTQQCDPFGTAGDGNVRLAGGLYPESQMGRIVWECKEHAVGRFRMVCTGGEYGGRVAPDGGKVTGFHCEGGHRGQVMPLCKIHVRQFSVGPRAAGFDRSARPYGIVGGTVANELCPACAMPPEARQLAQAAELLHMQMSQYEVYGLGLAVPGRLIRQMGDIRQRLDELNADGRVHKCPLRLVEVS